MSRSKRVTALRLALVVLVSLTRIHVQATLDAHHIDGADRQTQGFSVGGGIGAIGPITAAPPDAQTGVVTTTAGTPASDVLHATSPAGFPITFALQTDGTKGTAVLTNAATGAFTYTPQAGAYGYDTFTFTATDAMGMSAPATEMVFIVAASAQSPGSITRVNVAADGGNSNGESGNSALSADGRYVAFVSLADNLVAGDTNGTADVFVRDRLTSTTTLLSVNGSGEQGNGPSRFPNMTPDGRYVVFESSADNLVDGDTNGECDVFLHDRITAQTTRVSVASNGAQATGSSCSVGTAPAISADGRFVAFESMAADLVPGISDGLYRQVFVRDRLLARTTVVSLNLFGFAGGNNSEEPSLSADGRYLAFASTAPDLVPGGDGVQSEVFVHDRSTGVISIVSVTSGGARGNLYSYDPRISADGRYVAFRSIASNLVPGDNNGFEDVFVRDLLRGETTRVSVATDGTEGNGFTPFYSMSADGRYVLFASTSTNLVPGDQNSGFDLFVHDLVTGETRLRAALGDSGNETLALSADGHVATVDSLAANLVPNDINAFRDVFVVTDASPTTPVAFDATVSTAEDTVAAGTLNAAPGGAPLNFTLVTTGVLGSAVLTDAATGTFTYTPNPNIFGTDAFTFKADNATAYSNVATVTVTITPLNDAPVAYDDTLAVATGASMTGTLVASDVDSPTLSYAIVASPTKGAVTITDPATGAYQYTANANASGSDTFTFTASDGALTSDVATIAITITGPPPTARTAVVTTTAGTPATDVLHATSPGGLTMTFALLTNGTKGAVALTDAATGAFTYTPQAGAYGYDSFTFTATDANGTSAPATEMVFIVAAELHWPGSTIRVSVTSGGAEAEGDFNPSSRPVVSADGRVVAFASNASALVPDDTNQTTDVFVHDVVTGETSRVSVASDGAQAAGQSALPAISADGRYVAFASDADHLVPDDSNRAWDMFVRDRVTGETSRITGDPGLPLTPYHTAISADGRYVAYASYTFDSGFLVPPQVFLHDRVTQQTRLASVASDGTPANSYSFQPALSADGRYVAFYSFASNLVSNDANGPIADIFVHDMLTGETRQVSVASDGTPGNSGSFNPALSADGRYVTFTSEATNLTPADTNGSVDLFVHDRETGETRAIGLAANVDTTISASGRYIAFVSAGPDVFVYDQHTGQTRRVATVRDGTPATGDSEGPSISADGRSVAFFSMAADLVADDTNGQFDFFLATASVPSIAPVATDASLLVEEDTVGFGALGASDPAGAPLTFSLVTTGTLGAAVLTNAATGTYTYTPNSNVFGTDTFTFTANNGTSDSNVATVTVTIAPVNDAPVAHDGALTVVAGRSAVGTLVATDVDNPGPTYAIVGNATKGAATLTDAATGAYEYFANVGASGTDTFTFTANDGALTSNVAAVTVTIAAAAQPPIARTDLVTTFLDTPVSGVLQATSPGGLPLTFALTANGTKGTAVLTGATTGAFTYTPQPGQSGYDAITFTATDGNGTSAPGTEIVFIVTGLTEPTSRVSVASSGTQANNASYDPALSADGRYVAFYSAASDLVAGDTNAGYDVFVHDRLTGETTRVSVASDGTQSNGTSDQPALSADGRYVIFRSYATNLVPNDTNHQSDVFVHDRLTRETTRVSVASGGVQANNASDQPAVSADGRYVAFHSFATNLVPGDTNGNDDVFVHDRMTGETTRVSVASGGAQANAWSYGSAISADGRIVAFYSPASNLVAGDTNVTYDVFVHDRQTNETSRVSVASDGAQGNAYSLKPALSADGRYVAFYSFASNLVAGDTNNVLDVFVHDRVTGQTTRASVASDGTQAAGPSDQPALSGDGRVVAFRSIASNLVAGDTNVTFDVFAHDLLTGQTMRVSVAGDGTQANSESSVPAVNGDGRTIAFKSSATNLVRGDTNRWLDVFVVNLALETTNVAPAITSANTATFTVGSAGSFTVTTTGVPSVTSITRSGALPAGVTFVDNGHGTATLAGTPAAGTGGTYPLTITASNGIAPDAVQPFTLTVSEPSVAVPQPPSNLTAISLQAGTVTLTWTDNSADETAFEIAEDDSLAVVRTVAADVTTSAFSGLDIGVSYHWYVRAVNANGASAWFGPVEKIPDGSDVVLPTITVISPTEPIYQRGSSLTAQYTCTDAVTCVGDIANGAAIDTSVPGLKSFRITATDAEGNSTTQLVTFMVSLGVCVTPLGGMTAWLPGDGSSTELVTHAQSIWSGAEIYTAGEVAQAFAVADGSFVSLPFQQTGPFTLQTWVRTPDRLQPEFTGIVSTGLPAQLSTSLQIGLDGFGNYRLDVGDGEQSWLIGPATDFFQHIAVTFDGSTIAAYLNGQLVRSDASTSTGLGFQILNVGIDRDGGLPFNGAIDEVQVFNRALTADEVGLSFAAGADGFCKNHRPTAVAAASPNPAEATGPTGATVTLDASGSIDPDSDTLTYAWSEGTVTLATDRISSLPFALGSHTVTLTVIDPQGSSASSDVVILVRDTTGPTVFLPADIAAEATSASGASVVWSATATDVVDGAVIVACSPPSGSTFAIGETSVSCSATDAHENTTTAGFAVTVRDTTPPTLALPTQVVVEATSPLGATPSYTATAVDAVSGPTAVSCVPASASAFALGTTFVNCAATDAAGNSAHGAFPVIVRDTATPTVQITSPSPDVLLAASSVDLVVQTTDVVGVTAVSVNGVAARHTTGTPQSGTWRATVPIVLPVAPGGALRFDARADDGAGNVAAATLLVDNDGIPSVLDRGRTNGADLSGIYSNDFNNGTTAGTLIRNGWTVKLSNTATTGGVRASAFGTGSVARILACIGTAKEVRLDVIGETADVACDPSTGTITVKAISAVPQIELRDQLASGVWQQFNLLTGQSMSVGSPAMASAANTAAIAVELLQIDDAGTETVVGAYELLPGSSVEVAVSEMRTGAGGELQFIVLLGEVRVTVNGVTRRLRPGTPARISIPPLRRRVQ